MIASGAKRMSKFHNARCAQILPLKAQPTFCFD